MKKIVVEVVGPLNQVVQDAAIGGRLEIVGVFLGIRGGNGMGIALALHDRHLFRHVEAEAVRGAYSDTGRL